MNLHYFAFILLASTAFGQTLDNTTIYNLSSGAGNLKLSASSDGQVVSGVSTTAKAHTVKNELDSTASQAVTEPVYKQPYISGQSEEIKAIMDDASKSLKDVNTQIAKTMQKADNNDRLTYAAALAVANHSATIAPQLDASGKSAKQTIAEIDSAKQQLVSTTGEDDSSKDRRADLQAKIARLEQQNDEGQKITQALIRKNGAESEAAVRAILDDPVNGYK